MIFAKLYEDTEYGQILVRIDEDGDEVVVNFTAHMNCIGLGFCSVGPSYSSDDKWEQAEAYLKTITVDKAV